MTSASPLPSDMAATEAIRQTDERGFAEPWMAEAFACVIQLSRQGLFTWSEWVEVFSTEIKTHPAQSSETCDAAYYRQWLAALETIVGLKHAASSAEITECQEAWRQAYFNTPHGQPVELRHAATAPAEAPHHHGHHPHCAPKPITVSPAQR